MFAVRLEQVVWPDSTSIYIEEVPNFGDLFTS